MDNSEGENQPLTEKPHNTEVVGGHWHQKNIEEIARTGLRGVYFMPKRMLADDKSSVQMAYYVRKDRTVYSKDISEQSIRVDEEMTIGKDAQIRIRINKDGNQEGILTYRELTKEEFDKILNLGK